MDDSLAPASDPAPPGQHALTDTPSAPTAGQPKVPCRYPLRPFVLMMATGFNAIGASTFLFSATVHPDVPVAIRWALGLQAFLLAVTGVTGFAAGLGILAARGVLSLPRFRPRRREQQP